MKQAEREEVWSRVNAQADSVFKDDESMKGFLNFMANCTPQSTRNLLILYEQNPEITRSRMYYEAISQVLPGVKLYINTTGADGVDMVLPLESFVDTGETATEPVPETTEGGN